jgi:cellulose synthase/poly-beta-1,6-N-acetylglucosamine synthase-like glycosyltransferase
MDKPVKLDIKEVNLPLEPVKIIVVGYNLPVVEQACLQSVVSCTNYPYVLTFVDNYNTEMTLTQRWNELVAWTPEEYVCLLNSDTVVSPKWLPRMMETLLEDDMHGFVGPSTNNCHSPQKNIATFEYANKHLGESEVMKSPISGFCLLFRKSIWDELEGFDERYKLYGQESDFVDRAQRIGYKALWRKDAFVWHEGEASVKAHGYSAKKERELAKKIYWSERAG